mgnify:CR=1 FL=1
MSKPEQAKRSVRVHGVIPPDLARELEELAKREVRKLGPMIRKLVMEALRRRLKHGKEE